MKVIIITNDEELKRISRELNPGEKENLLIYDRLSKPLDIVGYVFEKNPSLLVLDDDMISPDTFNVISNIKKMKKDLKIVFVTSNSSIELGKEITPLGISYYAIKPLEQKDFSELINSLTKNKQKINP